MQIGAGIVTYNPDLTRLKENLEAVRTQVDSVLIVDNGSENAGALRELISGLQNIEVIFNRENLGIGRASPRV